MFGNKCKQMLNNDFFFIIIIIPLRSIPKKFIHSLKSTDDGKCLKYNSIGGSGGYYPLDRLYYPIHVWFIFFNYYTIWIHQWSPFFFFLLFIFVFFASAVPSFANRFRFMKLRDNRSKCIILWHMSRWSNKLRLQIVGLKFTIRRRKRSNENNIYTRTFHFRLLSFSV